MPECAAAGFPEDDVRQELTMSILWESDRIGIQNQVSGPCPLPGNVNVRLQHGCAVSRWLTSLCVMVLMGTFD